MKEDGVKICISGSGADELFAGYYHAITFITTLLRMVI